MANKYPERILRDLRQRVYDLEEDDTSRDSDINTIDPVTAFKSVANWRLGNEWGEEIMWLLESCNLKVSSK